MDVLPYCKNFKVLGCHLNSFACKCVVLAVTALVIRAVLLPTFSIFDGTEQDNLVFIGNLSLSFGQKSGIRKDKFLEVPQIVWGLNNQKIAFARACLTARLLNRTLLMPSLSASLFYKEVELLEPISFDKVFQFKKFNSLCNGFVQLGELSDVRNRTGAFELQKGSGRRWTPERDMDQLKQHNEDPYNEYEVIRIVGKNPFLWHDHWPVKDYAKIFECMVLVDEIMNEADKVVSRIREIGAAQVSSQKEFAQIGISPAENSLVQPVPYVAVHMRIEIDWMIHCKKLEQRSNITQICSSQKEFAQIGISPAENSLVQPVPYVAVHMRIEMDWMIHCKKLEQRSNITQICSSKEEIMERVGNIVGLKTPVVVYLAIADSLLHDPSILNGWKEGLIPFEKKKLGVEGNYKKFSYLIQSAIDYEVCLRADVFVGNSFSTFSNLIVLDRTQKLIRTGVTSSCGVDVRWPSYAYNILGESKGPQRWMTNMSGSSLQAISYGSNDISC